MHRDTNAETRLQALLALEHRSAEEALRVLIDAIHDESVDVRLLSIKLLTKIGGPTAVKALENALKDADARVRLASLRALGQIGGRDATQAIIHALQLDDDAVQVMAEQLIDTVLDKEGVGVLIESLNHEDDKVRSLMIRALGNKKWKVNAPNDVLIERLFALIRNGDLYLRNKAALLLAEIGQPVAPKLLAAKRDADRKVRRAACMALDIIRAQEKKSLYDQVRKQNLEG